MDKDFITKYKIAHRGGFYDNINMAEQCLKVFELAAQRGYALEMDTQFLQDGNIAIFHHATMDSKRLIGKELNIRKLTAEQLKQIKLVTGETIPTLSEVLQLVNGKVPLLIEIKTDRKTISKQCETIVNALKNYKGDFAIQTFDFRALKWLKQNAPEIKRGLLVSPWSKHSTQAMYRPKTAFIRYVTRNMWFAKSVTPHFISYEADFLPSKKLKKLFPDIPVLGWVISNTEQYKKAAPYMDNIIFEHFIPDPKIKMGEKNSETTL